MVPAIEGPQDILARVVVSLEKPDVFDSEKGQRAARFHLAHLAKSRTSLVAYAVAASVAIGAVDHGDAFALVEADARQVAADDDIIIGMSHDQEQIGFIASIRQKQRRRDRLRGRVRKKNGREDGQKLRADQFERLHGERPRCGPRKPEWRVAA